MFGDLLQFLAFGQTIKYEGKEYTIIQPLTQGYTLVTKKGATMPAQTYVIKDPEYDKVKKADEANSAPVLEEK